jgi:hypothetical protein
MMMTAEEEERGIGEEKLKWKEGGTNTVQIPKLLHIRFI